jgi:hypothetical protein
MSAISIWSLICVFFVELMSFGAVSFSSVDSCRRHGSGIVFCLSNGFEMLGIHARPVPAQMVDLIFLWDLTLPQLVRISVSQFRRWGSNGSVPMRSERTLPLPAVLDDLDLGKEFFLCGHQPTVSNDLHGRNFSRSSTRFVTTLPSRPRMCSVR